MTHEEKLILLDKYNRPSCCSACGKMLDYNGLGEYRCRKCGNLEYDDYGKVRNYVEEHKGANIAEISYATGVEDITIKTMLREERFEITSDSKVFLQCRGCGKEIRSGEYCDSCGKIHIAAELRKKKDAIRKEHEKNISGVGVGAQTTQDGAKRFTREK